MRKREGAREQGRREGQDGVQLLRDTATKLVRQKEEEGGRKQGRKGKEKERRETEGSLQEIVRNRMKE